MSEMLQSTEEKDDCIYIKKDTDKEMYEGRVNRIIRGGLIAKTFKIQIDSVREKKKKETERRNDRRKRKVERYKKMKGVRKYGNKEKRIIMTRDEVETKKEKRKREGRDTESGDKDKARTRTYFHFKRCFVDKIHITRGFDHLRV